MKRIVCVLCPRSCRITIVSQQGEYGISGNSCPKGRDYALQEMKEPLRTLTTTVCTAFPDFPRLPVRTEGEIPFRLFPVLMEKLSKLVVGRRVIPGEVVFSFEDVNILSTADCRALYK